MKEEVKCSISGRHEFVQTPSRSNIEYRHCLKAFGVPAQLFEWTFDLNQTVHVKCIPLNCFKAPKERMFDFSI